MLFIKLNDELTTLHVTSGESIKKMGRGWLLGQDGGHYYDKICEIIKSFGIQGISQTFGCGNHVCRFEPAAMEIQ